MTEAEPVRPIPAARVRPPRPGFFERLRGYFLAGLLVAGPISITLYLSWLVVSFIDQQSDQLLPAHLNPDTYLPFTVPGIGILTMLLVITGVGWLAAGYLGGQLLGAGERLMHRLPFLRGIYGMAKQLAGTVLRRRGDAFRQIVMAELPRRGVWSPAFLYGEAPAVIEGALRQRTIGVLVPRTPGMTASYLYFVPPEEVRPMGLTLEEGLKLVVSGGIVTPAARPRVTAAGPVQGPVRTGT